MKARKYAVTVKDEAGTSRFTRNSFRTLMVELGLLWDEYPKATRITIQPKATK